MENILVKLIGYHATLIHGDSAVFDRYRWLKKNLKAGDWRTLDAGCGSGAFTMYAAKIGNEAVGISFDKRNNEKAAERAKILNISNVSFIDGDLRKLDEMSGAIGKFNQIICFETIEHIINDKKLVGDFFSLLKSGGKLLLTAPYKFYKSLYGDKDKLSTYEDGGHVRCGYTHEEIADLLKKSGFEIEILDYVSGYFSQQVISLQRFLASKINPKLAWLIVMPFRIFQFFDPLMKKVIKYPYLSIAVVAMKK